MRRAEQWFTLVLLAVVIIYATLALRINVTMDDAVGPRSYPLLLATIMGAVCLLNLLRIMREKDGEPAHLGLTEALFVLTGFAYFLAMNWLGYVIPTILFTAIGVRLAGEKRWLPTVTLAVVASLFIWGLFDKLLGVTLPVSPLGII